MFEEVLKIVFVIMPLTLVVESLKRPRNRIFRRDDSLAVKRPNEPQQSIEMNNFYIGRINKILKRSLDIVGSIMGLVIALPFFIVVPILIKINSRGPVFYVQERIGLNRRKANNNIKPYEFSGTGRRCFSLPGTPFELLKFRTMVTGAEKHSGPVWAVKNDPRITKVGRFLRKTRIDEIPQLLNVLKGDMSLVGPRPERPFFVRDFIKKIPEYRARLIVRPGITGLAQIKNGYDSSFESVIRKVNYDLNYLRNWSIFSDLKIILKTVIVIFTTKGAL